ncbi:hypothetical protein JCGZ_24888 [Jatropha curcas]|uniref:Uncharacterized protein n=1 Tax=Jatropha curcas TaxID=180498 RepID=A0A067L9U7_JATCU|nr:hypothetical protein JCGZ_24888 [Jatropha curcas]
MASEVAEQSLPSSDRQNIPAPVTLNEINAIISILHRMRQGESTLVYGCMNCYMYNLLGNLKDPEPLDALIQSCILKHLAALYASENIRDSKKADYYIRYLLYLMIAEKTTGFLDERASVILQLCKFLRTMVCLEDSLYVLSLHSLRDLAEKANYVLLDRYKILFPEWQTLPMFDDLAYRLLKDLHQCITSPSTKETMDSLISDFRDFKALSRLLYHAIQEQKEKQEDKGKEEEEEEEEKAAPISSERYKNDGRKLSIHYICFKLLHDIEFLL